MGRPYQTGMTGEVVPSFGSVGFSDCLAAVLDVESIRVDVQLRERTPFRPRQAAKVCDVLGSSFSCLLRHAEGHIDQDDVLDGQRGFPFLRSGSEVFNRGGTLKPRESLGIFPLPVVLAAKSYVEAVRIASNHDGDSDSTASIAGQIWGAWKGLMEIPHEWITKLDVFVTVLRLARETLHSASSV